MFKFTKLFIATGLLASGVAATSVDAHAKGINWTSKSVVKKSQS